jgi:NAD(P)H-hydrate epimerase
MLMCSRIGMRLVYHRGRGMATPILTRAEMRAYDAHAIERCGVPGLVLMENAGRGAAEVVARELGAPPAGPVVIVCGGGNNGGDGFVVGRHLRARGHEVRCFLACDRERVGGDARASLGAYEGTGGALEILGGTETLRGALARARLCVDALLGTGLDRPVEGTMRALIDEMNAAPCTRVALDVPSGIDADRGRLLGAAVEATLTVTFGCLKTGLVQGEGARRAGRIVCVPLGVPDGDILAAVGSFAAALAPADARAALGVRAPDEHKYRAGSVLVVAGSLGKLGAARLCARAALRSGAGIVTIATWPDAAAALDETLLEAMSARLDPSAPEASLETVLDKRSAVAVGPGLGTDERARRAVDRVALGWSGPVVLDADAVTLFAARAETLAAAPGPRVLTPHAGELARLLGTSARDVEDDRFAAADAAAAHTGAVVVLKGRNTVVAAPGGRRRVCLAGSEVLATGGSGDVLAGVVAALLGRAAPFEAAGAAVLLHALAADAWRARTGADRGLVAGDLVDLLPEAIASVGA